MPHGAEEQENQQQHQQLDHEDHHHHQQQMTEYPDALNLTRKSSGRSFRMSRHGDADSDDGLSPTANAVTPTNKQDVQFHKLFPVIPMHEALIETYSCALRKDFLYHGRMFLSENWICFHSRIIHKQIQVTIPAAAVRSIKKYRMVKVLPNALRLVTSDGTKYRFTTLMSRDTTYNHLHSLCKNLEGDDPTAMLCLDFGPSVTPSRRTRPQSLLLNADNTSPSGWGKGGSIQRRKSYPGITRWPGRESQSGLSTQCGDTTPADDSPDGPMESPNEERWQSDGEASTSRGPENGHWGRDTPRCNSHATGLPAGSPPNGPCPAGKKRSLCMLWVYFVIALLLVALSCYLAVRINLLEETLAGIPRPQKPPLCPLRYGEL